MIKALFTFTLLFSFSLPAEKPLSSWNQGQSKTAIMNYVKAITDKTSPDFIAPEDRIAVFDNDGTLWSEQPAYFQFFFAIDRIKALAPQHPKWKTTEPFKSVLENNMTGIIKSGQVGLMKLVEVSHSGMDAESFRAEVKSWITTAKHPTKHRLYTELIFQPMMELIGYLESNGFKVFIISGGGLDFMRAFIPEVYGIPSEQIIGSTGKVHYENGKIIKEPKVAFIDDKEGKPVAIYYHIGKRPIAAFGNSDGDLAMMQYTEANDQYKTLQLYVHHTDDKREWKYDRESHMGKLDKGLDYAKEHNWTIVDMAKEWKAVFPFEVEKEGR